VVFSSRECGSELQIAYWQVNGIWDSWPGIKISELTATGSDHEQSLDPVQFSRTATDISEHIRFYFLVIFPTFLVSDSVR